MGRRSIKSTLLISIAVLSVSTIYSTPEVSADVKLLLC